jgi:hypothetical protein
MVVRSAYVTIEINNKKGEGLLLQNVGAVH